MRRNSYGIQNHHEVSTEGEEEGNDDRGDLSYYLIKLQHYKPNTLELLKLKITLSLLMGLKVHIENKITEKENAWRPLENETEPHLMFSYK